jgi:hypothetical protein
LALDHPPESLWDLPIDSHCAELVADAPEATAWDFAIRVLCPEFAAAFLREPLRPGDVVDEAERLERCDNTRDFARLNMWALAPERLAAVLEAEAIQAEAVRERAKTMGRSATRAKKSTEKGEARAKIVGALTLHHKYKDGGCLNTEPIGVNELARLACVASGSVTRFFNNQFGGAEKDKGHTKYKVVCRDLGRLAESLKVLNAEFSPDELYGRNPPGEGGRDDED